MNASTVAAAEAAINRIDDGEGHDADEALADRYDRFLQAEQNRHDHAQHEQEQGAWLAGQCGGCIDGGTGETCDEHHEEEDGDE